MGEEVGLFFGKEHLQEDGDAVEGPERSSVVDVVCKGREDLFHFILVCMEQVALVDLDKPKKERTVHITLDLVMASLCAGTGEWRRSSKASMQNGLERLRC